MVKLWNEAKTLKFDESPPTRGLSKYCNAFGKRNTALRMMRNGLVTTMTMFLYMPRIKKFGGQTYYLEPMYKMHDIKIQIMTQEEIGKQVTYL